jgi:hypothetical protein
LYVRSMEGLAEPGLNGTDCRAAPKQLDRDGAGTARCRACSERAMVAVRELATPDTAAPPGLAHATPCTAARGTLRANTARPTRSPRTELAMTLDVLLIAARADG